MAKSAWRNCMIVVNGQDISNFVREVSIEGSFDEVDLTGFQAAFKETDKGIPDATITMTVYQDFSAAAIDQLLWPIFQATTPVTVAVRPTNGAKSTTNPEYSMSAKLYNYNPISGAVGDAAETPVTWRNASQAGITRATS